MKPFLLFVGFVFLGLAINHEFDFELHSVLILHTCRLASYETAVSPPVNFIFRRVAVATTVDDVMFL